MILVQVFVLNVGMRYELLHNSMLHVRQKCSTHHNNDRHSLKACSSPKTSNSLKACVIVLNVAIP